MLQLSNEKNQEGFTKLTDILKEVVDENELANNELLSPSKQLFDKFTSI